MQSFEINLQQIINFQAFMKLLFVDNLRTKFNFLHYCGQFVDKKFGGYI